MTNIYPRELLPDHVTTVKSAIIGHGHRKQFGNHPIFKTQLFFVHGRKIVPGKFCNRSLTEILIQVPISHFLTKFNRRSTDFFSIFFLNSILLFSLICSTFVYFCEKNSVKKTFFQKQTKTEIYRLKYRLTSVKKWLIGTQVKISVNFGYFRLKIGYTTRQEQFKIGGIFFNVA